MITLSVEPTADYVLRKVEGLYFNNEPLYTPASGMCAALSKARRLGAISYAEWSIAYDEVQELIETLRARHNSDNLHLTGYANPDKCREIYRNWSKRRDLLAY